MLFGPGLRYFNELEINGETVEDDEDEDYTADEPELEDEEDTVEDTEDTTGDDQLDDYTAEEFYDDEDDVDVASEEEGEDVEGAPAELDDYTTEEFEDDETVDDIPEETDETVDDTEEPAEEGGDELTDFTAEEFEDEDTEETEGGEDTGADADNDAEETTDYTQEDFDAEGDDAGSTEGEEGEEAVEGEESTDTADANTTDNTLAGMEKNLFADLSPQQLAIKNNELLQNYIELYETINTIFDNINKIPKTFDNTRPLTFITDQLVSLKDMVNYVITTTYVTRTYVENVAYYKQALLVLQQLNTMLKALVQKPSK